MEENLDLIGDVLKCFILWVILQAAVWLEVEKFARVFLRHCLCITKRNYSVWEFNMSQVTTKLQIDFCGWFWSLEHIFYSFCSERKINTIIPFCYRTKCAVKLLCLVMEISHSLRGSGYQDIQSSHLLKILKKATRLPFPLGSLRTLSLLAATCHLKCQTEISLTF